MTLIPRPLADWFRGIRHRFFFAAVRVTVEEAAADLEKPPPSLPKSVELRRASVAIHFLRQLLTDGDELKLKVLAALHEDLMDLRSITGEVLGGRMPLADGLEANPERPFRVGDVRDELARRVAAAGIAGPRDEGHRAGEQRDRGPRRAGSSRPRPTCRVEDQEPQDGAGGHEWSCHAPDPGVSLNIESVLRNPQSWRASQRSSSPRRQRRNRSEARPTRFQLWIRRHFRPAEKGLACSTEPVPEAPSGCRLGAGRHRPGSYGSMGADAKSEAEARLSSSPRSGRRRDSYAVKTQSIQLARWPTRLRRGRRPRGRRRHRA